jgi:hypothetical protein
MALGLVLQLGEGTYTPPHHFVKAFKLKDVQQKSAHECEKKGG